MIILNTPHNPTATILHKDDIDQLSAIVKNQDILILSDEVYEHLIYDGEVHHSMARYAELRQRSFIVASFGKLFHATGWKVGYTVAPELLTREIRKAHQFITFSVNTPMQLALAEYLGNPENYLSLGKFYQQKRDFFINEIKGSSLKPLPCFGSYFQLLSYESVSEKSDIEMAEWMTKEMKLAPIPVSAFYKDNSDHKLLRFCFAKGEETLQKAGKILRVI